MAVDPMKTGSEPLINLEQEHEVHGCISMGSVEDGIRHAVKVIHHSAAAVRIPWRQKVGAAMAFQYMAPNFMRSLIKGSTASISSNVVDLFELLLLALCTKSISPFVASSKPVPKSPTKLALKTAPVAKKAAPRARMAV